MRADGVGLPRIIIIFFSLLLALPLTAKEADKSVKIESGILDLKNWDFTKDGIYEIKSGSVTFVPNLHYQDDTSIDAWKEIISEKGYELEFSQVISNQPGKDGNSDVPFDIWGTYYFKIKLPASLIGQNMSISTKGMISAIEVRFINMKDFKMDVGQAGSTADSEVPWAQFTEGEFVVPDSAELEVAIKISNFSEANPGQSRGSFFLAPTKMLKDYNYSRTIRGFMVLGVLIVLSLYHFILFSLRREDKPSLFFAIFSLLMAMRLLTFDRMLAPLLEPSYLGHSISMRLEYWSVLVLPLAFLFFLSSILPTIFRMKVSKVFGIVGLLLTTTAVFASLYDLNKQILLFYQIFLLVIVIYMLMFLGYGCFLGLIKGSILKREVTEVDISSSKLSRFIFIFALILAVASANDIMIALKVIDSVYISEYGVIAFFLGQSYLLARAFAGAYRQAEHLSRNLQHEVEKQTSEISEQKQTIEKTMTHIKNDLKVAAEVMEVMLPAKEVANNQIDLKIFFQPADELAGDLFGQELRGTKLMVWVCDVTGHGVASSMVASVVRESIAACRIEHLFEGDPDPAGALAFTSARVARAVHGKLFATMSLALYDLEEKKIYFAGASHLMPFYFANGEKKGKSLPIRNGPLIGSEDAKRTYSNAVFGLNTGDMVFMYTDGINEAAFDMHSPEYGKNRIRRFIDGHRAAENLNDLLFEDMIKFQKKETLDDDVTLVTLRVLE